MVGRPYRGKGQEGTVPHQWLNAIRHLERFEGEESTYFHRQAPNLYRGGFYRMR
jgi:hypothetical protein